MVVVGAPILAALAAPFFLSPDDDAPASGARKQAPASSSRTAEIGSRARAAARPNRRGALSPVHRPARRHHNADKEYRENAWLNTYRALCAPPKVIA